MGFNTAIFDLDGTLLNTITDIANSVNFVLEKHNFETHDLDTIKSFVGNGLEVLMRLALPNDISKEKFDVVFCDFVEHYDIHKNDQTAPYEGILDMLKKLKEKGIKTAILSNKADRPCKELSAEIFGNLIDYAKGFCDKMPPKPSADGIFHVAQQIGSKLEECIFVGDSEVDIQTGLNAKVYTVGVTWGFRTVDVLVENGATKIVNSTTEIIDIFEGK